MASDHPTRITILGLGQMGLVCSQILDQAAGPAARHPEVDTPAPPELILWGHDPEEAGRLSQSRTSDRLPGFTLPTPVQVALSDAEALANTDLIVLAIPTQFIRPTLERLRQHTPPGVPIVSVSKGIETGSLLTPTEVVPQALDDPARPVAVLSGPTIATELARCMPAVMTVACVDADLSRRLQHLFATSWLRLYTHDDVRGVEIAGATKNVIAIAAGILDGLQAGCNAKSALLARGLAEIARLGAALGARPDTFFGIAGVGDLATTCFSPHGRNRSCGEALGRGQSIEQYLATSESVVEGVATTQSATELARRHGVDMPIAQAVRAVLFEGLDPIEAIGQLMSRDLKPEQPIHDPADR